MENTKKPVYKKWWVWLIAVMLVVGIIGVITEDETEGSKEKPVEAKDNDVEGESSGEEEEQKELTREEEIQALVADITDDDFMATEIKEVAVNPDLGNDDGNFIVLPKLKWEMSNKAKRTKVMLEEYSDHLAAKLAAESDINEITVFWEVPYHLEGDNVAKFNYSRSGDDMAIGEVWYAPKLED